MATISKITEKETYIDEDGKERTSIVERTHKVERSKEPDFIKLYTKMWLDFNQIPSKWHELFLQLVLRMSYANAKDPDGSQIVIIYGQFTNSICKACGWSDKSTLRKGLKALCDCGAIRRVDRASYQISPEYAARGEWKYNPVMQRGGVEDLVATFRMSRQGLSSSLHVAWADDPTDLSEEAKSMRSEYGEGFIKSIGTTLPKAE